MGIPLITTAIKGFKVVGKIKRVIKEGKDVQRAAQKIEDKYEDLDDDLKDAWNELREFIQAIKEITLRTRAQVNGPSS